MDAPLLTRPRGFGTLAAALLALTAASCTRDVSLPDPVPNTVSGRVVADEPGTGRLIPAAGARLEWVGTGQVTFADAQTGRFRFDQVPPPPRTLWLQWASTASGELDRQRVLAGGLVDAKGAVELGDLQVASDGELQGRVLLGDRPDDSAAQAGTVVFLQKLPYAAVTVAGGGFFLPRLPTGTFSVGLFRAGYAPITVDNVTVGAGASLTLGDLSLAPLPPGSSQEPGTVRGIVLGTDGAPASGAVVTAVAAVAAGSGAPPTATAGPDGSFELTLVPGAYRLVFHASAGVGQASLGGVLVLPGQTADTGTVSLSDAAAPPVTAPGAPPLPVADCGLDQTVMPSAAVALDGSASTGGNLIFHWFQTSGDPVVILPNHSTFAGHASFVAPAASQTLELSLVVEDALGQTSAGATCHVFVNAPPTALLHASPATVAIGGTITLDATGSTDPEGNPLRFTLRQVEGPQGVLQPVGTSGAQATFVASAAGTYGFEVAVSDGHASAVSSPVRVEATSGNHPPVAHASLSNLTRGGAAIWPGDELLLDGSSSFESDPGQHLSFAWTASPGSGAPACATCAATHLIVPAGSGTYSYQLTVTDDGTPALQGSVALSFTVSTAVVDAQPADGDQTVAPLAPIAITYSSALDPASLDPTAVVVTSGGVALPGSAHLDASGTVLTWVPSSPLPGPARIDVMVPPLLDSTGHPTPAAQLSFTTRMLQWADHSPLNPQRPDPSSGKDTGFSYYPFDPALATGPLGSFLAWTEWTNASSDGVLTVQHWNTQDQSWEAYARFADAFGVPSSNLFYDNPEAGTPLAHRPARASLGFDPTGNPVVAYDQDQSGGLAAFSTAPDSTGPWLFATGWDGPGGAVASDGVSTLLATRFCSQLSLEPTLSLAPVEAGLAETRSWLPEFCNSTGLSSPALVSSSGRLFLAVGYELLGERSNPWAMSLFTRAAGGSDFTLVDGTGPLPAFDAGAPPQLDLDAGMDPDAGADAGMDPDAGDDAGTDAGDDAGTDAGDDAGTDAGDDAGTDPDAGDPDGGPGVPPIRPPEQLPPDTGQHLAGDLSGARISEESAPALTLGQTGPLLAFVEFLDPDPDLAPDPGSGQLRATVFNELVGFFQDPAGGADTSSIVAPALPDGSGYTHVGQPAVAALGSTSYVAFIALNTRSNHFRVYVAHTGPGSVGWVLDADGANADGALDVEEACQPTSVALTLVDGHPTATWAERCAIAAQPTTAPYALHTRNAVYVKRLE